MYKGLLGIVDAIEHFFFLNVLNLKNLKMKGVIKSITL